MKKYKFITIEKSYADENTYLIYNNKSRTSMGDIVWYPPWKQWVFKTDYDFVWSADCLRDVINFIENEIPK